LTQVVVELEIRPINFTRQNECRAIETSFEKQLEVKKMCPLPCLLLRDVPMYNHGDLAKNTGFLVIIEHAQVLMKFAY